MKTRKELRKKKVIKAKKRHKKIFRNVLRGLYVLIVMIVGAFWIIFGYDVSNQSNNNDKKSQNTEIIYRHKRHKKQAAYPKQILGLYQAKFKINDPRYSQNIKIIGIIRIAKHQMFIKFFPKVKYPGAGIKVPKPLESTIKGMDIQEKPKHVYSLSPNQYQINTKMSYMISNYNINNLKAFTGNEYKSLPSPSKVHWEFNVSKNVNNGININKIKLKPMSRKALAKYLPYRLQWWLGYASVNKAVTD